MGLYFLEQKSHVFSQDPHGLQSLGIFLDIPFIEAKRHVGIIRPDNEHFKTAKKEVCAVLENILFLLDAYAAVALDHRTGHKPVSEQQQNDLGNIFGCADAADG